MPTDSDVRDNPAERRFELSVDGELAVAEYQLDEHDPATIAFTHTFVPEALRGRGIATRIVKGSLDAARARGLAVEPRCAMFAAYMKSHPETQDLLTPQARQAIAT